MWVVNVVIVPVLVVVVSVVAVAVVFAVVIVVRLEKVVVVSTVVDRKTTVVEDVLGFDMPTEADVDGNVVGGSVALEVVPVLDGGTHVLQSTGHAF